MTLVLIGIERHAIRYFLVAKFGLNRARLRVPQLNKAIVGRRQKLRPVSIERYVAHTLRMSTISSNAASLFVKLPEFNFRIHGAGEEQMARYGEQLHSLYALGMAFVRVHALLGYEALLGRLFGSQVFVDVLRYVQERSAQIVERVVDV